MNTLEFIIELETLQLDDRAIISAVKYVNSPAFDNNRSDKMIDVVDELDAIKQSIKEQEIIANTEFTPHYYESTMCKL